MMKTQTNGNGTVEHTGVSTLDTLHSLRAELLRLEDLAKNCSSPELELLIGAAVEAASDMLGRQQPLIN